MKVAVVGTGQIAQRHLKGLRAIDGVEVVGHVGTSPAKADAAASTWGGRGYTTIDDLLKAEKPDAVWLTVPPTQHGPLEYLLLDAGIPFMVEKPLSADRLMADEIGAAIARKNALVAVGYNWRALDTVPGVRAALAQHRPRMVIGTLHANIPAAAWWRHQAESGGQMVEQATHLIDLSRALIGEGVVVSAQAGAFDRPDYPDADIAGVSAALLRFGDVVGVYSASNVLAKGAGAQLQIVCDKLLITFTLAGVTYDDGETQRREEVQQYSYEVENRAFLDAIRQNNPALIYSSYADALRTHHLCHDILEQSQETSAKSYLKNDR